MTKLITVMAEMTMMLLLFIQANNDKRYDIYHQTETIKSVTMLLIEKLNAKLKPWMQLWIKGKNQGWQHYLTMNNRVRIDFFFCKFPGLSDMLGNESVWESFYLLVSFTKASIEHKIPLDWKKKKKKWRMDTSQFKRPELA